MNIPERDELPEMEFEMALCVLDAAIVKVRQHAWPQSMELEMARKVLANGRLCRAGREDDSARLDWLMSKPLFMVVRNEDGDKFRVENYGNNRAMSADFHTPREAIDDAIRRLSPQAGGSDE